MVFRVVLNSRAMALMLIPALIRSITTYCCSLFNAEGRPNRFPAAFALAIPESVRSSKRSLSNSATAEMTCMVLFPAGLVRSTPPKARQFPGMAALILKCKQMLQPLPVLMRFQANLMT